MKKFLCIALLIASNNVLSQTTFAEVTPRRAAGDMSFEFKNHRYPASSTPLILPSRNPVGKEVDIVQQARQMASENPLLSIIMVERGEIIFEAYNSPASATRPNFSWSMSKSLTAYTLGLMNCETNLIDYNSPAQNYSDDLKGTVYGEATVRNLLTMSSGIRKALSSGDHLWKKDGCTSGTDCDGWELGRSQRLSGVEYLNKVKERDTDSGKEFRYSGTDTLALSNIVDKNGGFIKQFEQHIWSKIGAESAGYWLLDKDNKAISQAGFSATTRDWAKLAMYMVHLSKKGTACQQQFIKDATSPQITNYGNTGRLYREYGYQTWINTSGPRPSYWWVGYGGQRVAVDPEKERILVVTSYKESYMVKVRDLFVDWQNN
jgi:CubicO group peptidase (beta-lactamase class C family)